MENNYKEEVQKIQKSETLYGVFGAGTKQPFITCDEESFNDQVWIFSQEEKAKEFSQERKDGNQDILLVVKFENGQLLQFFASLFTLGVNEVVFRDGEVIHKIPLEKIVLKPDYSKLPEEKRPLTNPQVQLTGLTFMQELHRQKPNNEKPKLHELEEEMAANLVRSTFLVAMEFEGEAPKPDSSNVKIPCVKNKDGKMFQPIFTDGNELNKFNSKGKFKASLVKFSDVQKIIGKNVEGIVVNPQSMNIVIMKDKIQGLLERFQ